MKIKLAAPTESLNLSCSSNEHEIVDITFAVVTQIITFTGLKQSFIC